MKTVPCNGCGAPIVFALTSKQLKALEPIMKEANRSRLSGLSFCVIAQVKLLPTHGPYTRAIVRARLVGDKGFQTVKRALARAGLTTRPNTSQLSDSKRGKKGGPAPGQQPG